jgi:hypothetical protein
MAGVMVTSRPSLKTKARVTTRNKDNLVGGLQAHNEGIHGDAVEAVNTEAPQAKRQKVGETTTGEACLFSVGYFNSVLKGWQSQLLESDPNIAVVKSIEGAISLSYDWFFDRITIWL